MPHVWRMLIGVTVVLMATVGFAEESFRPSEGQVSLKAHPLRFETSNNRATIMPIVALREDWRDGVRPVDLLIQCYGEVLIIDPFFSAPGLNVALAAVFDREGESVKYLHIPRTNDRRLRTGHIGSLKVPSKGIVGGAFELHALTGKPIGDEREYFLQLLLVEGVAARDFEFLHPVSKEIVARSAAVSLGRFPGNTGFELKRHPTEYRTEQRINRRPRTIEVNVVAELDVYSHGWAKADNTTIRATFKNLGQVDVSLFNPWLLYRTACPVPGSLWLTEKSDGNRVDAFRLDFETPGSMFPPNESMCASVPPQGIIGGVVRVGRYDVDGEITAQLEMNRRFLCQEREWDSETGNGTIDNTPGEEFLKSRPVSFTLKR